MAIPKFLEDLEIISKLGENPGADNGLSTSAFRAKFDEAALKIQRYMNEVLIPNLDMLVDVSALLNSILDKTLSVPDKAAEAKAVGDALANKLNSTGGTMTGPLNVTAPTEEAHAANKGYVDTAVKNVDVSGKVDKTSVVNNFTTTEEGFVADARALKTLNDNKLSMELLWENASPTSDFGEQTIAIDTLNYSYFKVVWLVHTSLTRYASMDVFKGVENHMELHIENLGFRTCNVLSNGLEFGAPGYYKTYGSTSMLYDAKYAIPCRIYGIKGVS